MLNVGMTEPYLLHADVFRHGSEFSVLSAVCRDQTSWNPTEWQIVW